MKIKIYHFEASPLASRSLTASHLKAKPMVATSAILWLMFNAKHKLYKTNLRPEQVEILLGPDSKFVHPKKGKSTILEY